MYIRLGQTKLNKISSPFIEDGVVFASVIDSGMSFEKPTTVRTIEELDMWFGTDFPEYDYFTDLLSKGTSLVLSKPLLEGIDLDYIDYKKVGRINLHKDDPLFPDLSDIVFPLKSGNYRCKNGVWELVSDEESLEFLLFSPPQDISSLVDINVPADRQNFIIESIGHDGDIEELEWDRKNGGFIYHEDQNDYSQDVSNSASLYNRDTLCLCDMSSGGYLVESYYPMTRPPKEFDKYLPRDISSVNISKSGIDTERIAEGKDILVSSIDTNNIFWNTLKELMNPVHEVPPYFVIQLPSGGEAKTVVPYFISSTTTGDIKKGLIAKLKEHLITKGGLSGSSIFEEVVIDTTLTEKEVKSSILDNLMSILPKNSSEIEVHSEEGIVYIVPTGKLVKLNSLEFSEVPGLFVTPERWISSYYLEKLLSGQDRALFVSKTIGSCKKYKSPIRIRIEDITDFEYGVDNIYYRITITRGKYEEVFEGPLFGMDRLDVAISNNSRLVRASFNDWYTKDGRKILYSKVNSTGDTDIIPNLPEGSWEMRGSYYEEDLDTDSYRRPIQKLINDGYEQWPIDFILIPKIQKFCKDDEDYEFLINASESLNCQVLIQNSRVEVDIVNIDGDKLGKTELRPDVSKVYCIIDKVKVVDDDVPGFVEMYRYYSGADFSELSRKDIRRLVAGSDFVDNVVDKNNRLVYFYGDMKVNGKTRPGYFVFLEDLFKNDIYLGADEDIVYESPIDPLTQDVYTINKLSSYLKEKKSNYLVDNNHYYYYQELFSGPKPETSIWMRFISDRVRRDLEKNKWSIISKSTKSSIQSTILDILGKIKNKFSIVRDIKIVKFEMLDQKQALHIEIDTKISDVITSDITIDVILNYSN